MIQIVISTLIARWAYYSLLFKHHGYESEQEYRVVFTHRETLPVQYRSAHVVFTPYINVPTVVNPSTDKFPLESVTISPFIKHDQALIGVTEWLKSQEIGIQLNGVNQEIINSKVRIRF